MSDQDSLALDDGIVGAVLALRAAGIDTFSSCQGGGPAFGHAHMFPVVWFNGTPEDAKRAEDAANAAGYQVFQVARIEYERQGLRRAFWEIRFVPGAANRRATAPA